MNPDKCWVCGHLCVQHFKGVSFSWQEATPYHKEVWPYDAGCVKVLDFSGESTTHCNCKAYLMGDDEQ